MIIVVKFGLGRVASLSNLMTLRRRSRFDLSIASTFPLGGEGWA